jgi:hypothetical protein
VVELFFRAQDALCRPGYIASPASRGKEVIEVTREEIARLTSLSSCAG